MKIYYQMVVFSSIMWRRQQIRPICQKYSIDWIVSPSIFVGVPIIFHPRISEDTSDGFNKNGTFRYQKAR